MRLLVYVFGLVALTCVCSATEREAFIMQMVNDLDADGDGFVTEDELHSEFVITMDTNSSTFSLDANHHGHYQEPPGHVYLCMGAYGEHSSRLRNFEGFKLVTNLKETKEAKYWIVTEDEFINPTYGWPAFYDDSIEIAKVFFNNLDVVCMRLIRDKAWSSCGSLGPLDLIEHFADMDVNKDGQVSVSEGYSWMDKVYPSK